MTIKKLHIQGHKNENNELYTIYTYLKLMKYLRKKKYARIQTRVNFYA